MASPAFDVEGAKAAGYSAAEIADHLALPAHFNVPQARKAGYTDDEIISHLLSPEGRAQGEANRHRIIAGSKESIGADQKALALENATDGPGRDFAGGFLDTLGTLGSGMAAMPAAGLAGIGQSIANIGESNPETSAADRVSQVQEALTWKPRTSVGERAIANINRPFEALANVSDATGQKVSDVTGSQALGALANTAMQSAPLLLFRKGGTAGRTMIDRTGIRIEPKPSAVSPGSTPASGSSGTAPPNAAHGAVEPPEVTAARSYVDSTIGPNVWGTLSADIQRKLATIARSAGALQQLDPAALARQARLQSLNPPVPATRGQLTHNLAEMRREANVAGTDAGAPIADTYQAQNQALISNLEVLKRKVSGQGNSSATSITAEDAGRSVQDLALRGKQLKAKAATNAAYETARASPEAQMMVDPEPLKQWLGDPINAKDSSPLMGLLRGFVPDDGGGISVANLERIRQKLSAATQSADGTVRHTAGEAIGVIDQMTQGAGGELYTKARNLHAAERTEFGDQSAVSKLVDDKSGTDRRTALESTVSAISKGSLEDIDKVKSSLLTGGDVETRTAGRQAWREVRRQLVQGIIDKATGGATLMRDGTPNITPAALKKAIDAIGPDRMDSIFGPRTAAQLDNILQARQSLAMPSQGGPAVGSTTVQNALSFLGKGLDAIPLVGKASVDIAKGISKVRELGANARTAAKATTTPLDEAVDKAVRQTRSVERGKQVRMGAPAIPLSRLAQPEQNQRR